MNTNLQTLNWDLPLAIKIRKDIVRALNDFEMIKPKDHIMVCVSGGKDSTVLSLMLKEIQRRSEIDFSFECVCLDQKQPGFDASQFIQFFKTQNIPLSIISKDTYSVVKEKTPAGGTYCTLCSKFRRAILYDEAHRRGTAKLALGHHRDDLLQTLFLNLFYVGTMASMPPKLLSDDHKNVVIRPMCYVAEENIIELQSHWNFPVIPCNLCGSQEGLKRKKMKDLIKHLERDIPNVSASLMTALKNIRPTQLLNDDLHDFKNLELSLKTELVDLQ